MLNAKVYRSLIWLLFRKQDVVLLCEGRTAVRQLSTQTR